MTQNVSGYQDNLRGRSTQIWFFLNVILPAATLLVAGLIVFLTGRDLVAKDFMQSLPVLLVIALGTVSNVCNELRVLDRKSRPRLDKIVPGLMFAAFIIMAVLVVVYLYLQGHFTEKFDDDRVILVVIIIAGIGVAMSTGFRWYYLTRSTGNIR